MNNITFEEEKKLAYQTSADELIIRIIRGTYDLRIGIRNAMLFPRLHLFLFGEVPAAKASKAKIIDLWTKTPYWKHSSNPKIKNPKQTHKYNPALDIDRIKQNINNLVSIARGENAPKSTGYNFNFEEINKTKTSPNPGIMSDSVFNYSKRNAYWDVHEIYINSKPNLNALKKTNKTIGEAAHNIQKELLFSINEIIAKYVSERSGKNNNGTPFSNLKKSEDDSGTFNSECLDNDLGSGDLPNMPNNINTETAKERGGLPAQQIVSTSPGTNQKDVHVAFFKEKSDCKIKWSDQKKNNGFRCTFCWREQCREKGENPTKAHSQRFDRPDTVTYAYWICKKFGLNTQLDYKNILKLIHRPIGILKLAGQCHPVYDSLGYPVKIFYSPGFWEESSPKLGAYEIPDRSFMWVKDLEINRNKGGSWGIYIEALANVKNLNTEKNSDSNKKSISSSSKFNFGPSTDGKFTDILFRTSNSPTPPPVIIPFQDYALTGLGRIYDKWKNFSKRHSENEKIKNLYLFCCGFYIYLYQLYDKHNNNMDLGKHIIMIKEIKKFEEKENIDFYSELNYMINNKERLYNQCTLVINQSDNPSEDINIIIIYLYHIWEKSRITDKIQEKLEEWNAEYKDSDSNILKMSTPSDLKMFTSHVIGAVPVENNVSEIFFQKKGVYIEKEPKDSANGTAILLASQTHFNGWPEPFNRAIITTTSYIYQNTIETDLYRGVGVNNQESVDFIKSYNPFSSSWQNKYLKYEQQMNEDGSKKKFTINKYHRSENCTELQEAFRRWIDRNNKNDKYNENNIKDIETIFHTMMFYLIDNVRREHDSLFIIEDHIRSGLKMKHWTNKNHYWKIPWEIESDHENKGYYSEPRIDSSNIKNLIQQYIHLYSSWIYDNVMIRNPYGDGGKEKWKQENDNWLSDNNTTGAKMWSQLMRELFSTRNNEKRQRTTEKLKYKLSFVLNWSIGEKNPIFFNLKKLKTISQSSKSNRDWIIHKLIKDYFETFMPTKTFNDITNKKIWSLFFNWCKVYVLKGFDIDILLKDYEKGVASVGNRYKKSSRELNHVKIKF